MRKKGAKNRFFQGEEKGCSCSDCDTSCTLPDFSDELENEFVIVEGVDGVVFIMVILFVVGSIIFLATVFGSSVLQKSVVMRKLKTFFEQLC